jgi:DNA-binding beta-propeller fold protein YncE
MKRILFLACLYSSLCYSLVIQASAQQLLKGIDIGGQPGIPAANTSTNMIYVPNIGLNTLTVISGDSGSVVANVPIGTAPVAAAVNPTTNLVYVTVGSGVAVVDASTNTLVTTVAAEGAPAWIAVNPVTNMVYFSTYSTDFSAMNGSTNQVVETIETGLGCCSEGMAVDSDTNRIYVTLFGSSTDKGSLIAINGATNKLTVFSNCRGVPAIGTRGGPEA